MRARREPRRRTLFRDTRGLSAAEYIILMALICVVGFIAWRMFGGSTRERTRGAHQVVSGLATTSSADGENGQHAGGGSSATPATPSGSGSPPASAADGTPHGGVGDVQRGQHMRVAGSDEEYGEDDEVRRARLRSRNVRWVAILILTAAVLAVLLGKKRN
jgi:hypothetical protein